jgi:hypothetical protein
LVKTVKYFAPYYCRSLRVEGVIMEEEKVRKYLVKYIRDMYSFAFSIYAKRTYPPHIRDVFYRLYKKLVKINESPSIDDLKDADSLVNEILEYAIRTSDVDLYEYFTGLRYTLAELMLLILKKFKYR